MSQEAPAEEGELERGQAVGGSTARNRLMSHELNILYLSELLSWANYSWLELFLCVTTDHGSLKCELSIHYFTYLDMLNSRPSVEKWSLGTGHYDTLRRALNVGFMKSFQQVSTNSNCNMISTHWSKTSERDLDSHPWLPTGHFRVAEGPSTAMWRWRRWEAFGVRCYSEPGGPSPWKPGQWNPEISRPML